MGRHVPGQLQEREQKAVEHERNQAMKKTASSKRYPFSMAKHAHDLDLYRDHSLGLGDAGRHQEVTGLLWRVMDASDGRTALLDGQDYAWAMRIVAWADEYRANSARIH